MRKFIVKTLNGMAYGLFATLIVGVIFQQLGKLIGLEVLENLYITLSSLMGVGIGLGIGIVLNKKGLPLVLTAIMGGISTSLTTVITFNPWTFSINPVGGPGNPVTSYFVVVLGIYLSSLILKKKTPVDIIIVPFVMITISLLLTIVLSYPLDAIVNAISSGIDKATEFSPILMSIVISVSMGMLLTSPISSAAVAFAINLNGIAAGAAVVGTTIQMIGFAIQSIKDNELGQVISVAIGTSMLQFKNIVKKPIIWLPTIISSAITAPIVTFLFKYESTPAGAGMGTSGLVGTLQSLDAMNYSLESILATLTTIILGGFLVYIIDLILRKKNIIVENDLYIGEGI